MGHWISAIQFEKLASGETPAVPLGEPTGGQDSSLPRLVFPGAFNPLHEGHRSMAELSARILATNVEYEISIANVDKSALDHSEVDRRLAQFAQHDRLWLTRAATFQQKSEIFPGSVFVVGADTIVRIGDARYYGGDRRRCRQAIGEIARRGCRFLVFGRNAATGFQTLDSLALPPWLLDICDGVSEARFRVDISSTQLRG